MEQITRIKNSMDIRKGLNNQAVGLLPLLLLMFLNNFYTYLVSFVIAGVFCVVSCFTFWGLFRGRKYQFMLLPTALTLILYSLFLFLRLEPVLYLHSPLIAEWLLVAVLSVIGFSKRPIIGRVRKSNRSALKRAPLRTALNEFFFVAQIAQNIYTLHLFILLFYMILPENYQHIRVERLLYREAPLFIGLAIIVYEQIRVSMMKHGLAEEKWLPVLDKKGKVIGRIAYSVSLTSQARHYCHPVVRIAVVYDGMLYLVKRGSVQPVSPEALDHPFYGHVLFKQTFEQTVRELLGNSLTKGEAKPHLLVRYPFENERVTQLVSLYVLTLHSEEAFVNYVKTAEGKLWTPRQIEENLQQGLFSEYFEKEYAYLQHTVLLAEQYTAKREQPVEVSAETEPVTVSPTR